jgi:hypothetical protein
MAARKYGVGSPFFHKDYYAVVEAEVPSRGLKEDPKYPNDFVFEHGVPSERIQAVHIFKRTLQNSKLPMGPHAGPVSADLQMRTIRKASPQTDKWLKSLEAKSGQDCCVLGLSGGLPGGHAGFGE